MEIVKVKDGEVKYFTTKEEVVNAKEFYNEILKRVVIPEGKSLIAIWNKIRVNSMVVITSDNQVPVYDNVILVAGGDHINSEIVIDPRALNMVNKITFPEELRRCTINNAHNELLERSTIVIGEMIVKPGIKSEHIWVVEYAIIHNGLIDCYIKH